MEQMQSAKQVLNQMMGGSWITQAIYVAAELGIADAVAGRPRNARELAECVGADGDALYRLLRALACAGIFAEDEDGRFSLTPLAEQLRTDIPDSQRSFAIMMGAEFYQSWGNLLHLVKRVVARPGDIVEMRRNVLLLNGRPLDYIAAELNYAEQIPQEHAAGSRFAIEELGETEHPVMSVPGVSAMRDFGPIVVPEGQYFVLGDNRDLSRDSRYFGLVPRESILGRARGIILSFDITDKYQPRIGRFLSPLQ